MTQDFIRQSLVGLKVLLVMTVILGIAYPAAVWVAGQTVFHDKANGQVLAHDGTDRGSAIIGQKFTGDEWFHGRPSTSDHDGLASGASNLGPSNPDLLKAIEQRQREIAKAENVQASQIPPDAVTASASGLDPYISPEYAALQVGRVATERHLSRAVVQRLVREHTSGRQLGFLGQPRVNVLELNLALDDR